MRKAQRQSLITSVLALACLSAGPASAQWMGGRMDTNLYIGGNVGQSVFSKTCDNIPVDCDDKDLGWKVFAGYQFHRNIAVEAGYFDLGKASAGGLVGGALVSADAKVRGFELVGVGILPINQAISVFGKLGFSRSRVSVSGTGGSASENSTDFTFGLGGQYLFTPNLGARLEWQRYDGVGGNTTGKDDIDLFSLGLLYRF